MFTTLIFWLYLAPLIVSIVIATIQFLLKPAGRDFWIDCLTLAFVPILNWVVLYNVVYDFWENLYYTRWFK